MGDIRPDPLAITWPQTHPVTTVRFELKRKKAGMNSQWPPCEDMSRSSPLDNDPDGDAVKKSKLLKSAKRVVWLRELTTQFGFRDGFSFVGALRAMAMVYIERIS